MGFVDSTLLANERLIHRQKLHRIVFLGPLIVLVCLLLWFGILLAVGSSTAAIVMFLIAVLPFISTIVSYNTSEFAVTDKRVIVKVGFVKRSTHEVLLTKIESIQVDQSVLGRLMNYGTIKIIGSGGSSKPFTGIREPLEFRRAVQQQLAPQ